MEFTIEQLEKFLAAKKKEAGAEEGNNDANMQ